MNYFTFSTGAYFLFSLSGWIESAGCFRWTHLQHPALPLGLEVPAARLCLEDLENQLTHDSYVTLMDLYL